MDLLIMSRIDLWNQVRLALEEYTLATYGNDAVLRPMTRKEAVDYARLGPPLRKRSLQIVRELV
jgi:hypothetical protein